MDTQSQLDARRRGSMEDGERLSFDVMLMDSKRVPPVRLRDAAGIPATLYDAATGSPIKLNADLIAAIESEAARLSLSVDRYLAEVLRYSSASSALQGVSA